MELVTSIQVWRKTWHLSLAYFDCRGVPIDSHKMLSILFFGFKQLPIFRNTTSINVSKFLFSVTTQWVTYYVEVTVMNVRSLLSRRREKYEPRQRRMLHISLSSLGIVALLCSMVLLLLSGCSLFPTPAQSGTPTPGFVDDTTPTLAVSATPKPTQTTTITFSS